MSDSTSQTPEVRRPRLPSGVKFLIFFTVFWTLIVGTFDVFIAYVVLKQHAASSFPSVTGMIVSSEITSNTDSDGDTTHRPVVTFTYDVNDVGYTETGHRFGGLGSSDYGYAQRIVDHYPPGRQVNVFYNPRDPSEAVLETGVGGTEHALLLFLTPFNCVMLLLWSYLGGAAVRRVTGAQAGGVPIITRPGRTIARLPRFAPGPSALVAALAVSFVSVFIIAFTSGFDPSLTMITTVWIVTGASAVIVYFWRLFVVNTGAKDLIINHESHTVSLPKTFGRSGDAWCPIDRITDLRVRTITRSENSNDTYSPTLHWRDSDGNEQQEQLAEWLDEDRAGQFIEWLRRTLHGSS